MTIFSRELSCNVRNELVVDIVLYQVDGAATEATAHDTATSNTILLSHFIQEVEFLAAYLVFLAQAVVSLVLFLGLSTLGGGSISAGWADMMERKPGIRS